MTDIRARRPGRPPADRAPLSRDRILSTALDLVDADGLGALTMRRLARELGVDPMSIYHHVPHKAAVVSGLVERVFAQMELPTPGETWTQRVVAWAHAYRDLTRTHPHLVLQIVTDPAAVARASALIDPPLRKALAESGISPASVEICGDLIVDFVNGHALGQPSPSSDDPAAASSGFDAGLEVVLLGVRALAGTDLPRTTPHHTDRQETP